MRFVNNNIEILRSETPTIDVNFIDDKDGYPLTIPNVAGSTAFYVEFTIRKTVYDKTPVYRAYFNVDRYAGIEPYVKGRDVDNITDPPATEDKWNKLYKYTENGKYYYYNGTEWVEYNFNVLFPLPYEATSKFEVKTYKYQFTLIGGTEREHDANECPIVVNYNNPLLKPHDFVVGGSLSE